MTYVPHTNISHKYVITHKTKYHYRITKINNKVQNFRDVTICTWCTRKYEITKLLCPNYVVIDVFNFEMYVVSFELYAVDFTFLEPHVVSFQLYALNFTYLELHILSFELYTLDFT